MAKTIKLTIRVDEKEAEKIKENATKASMTVSEFLRRSALLTKVIRQKQCDELKLLIYELNKIGNNLNQIARKVNTVREIDIDALERLKNIEYALYLLIKTIREQKC